MLRVGADVGGTHTDLVLFDEAAARIVVHKVPTTVDDPSRGVVEALRELAAKADVGTDGIDYFMHGTTVATNIVLEHNGARAGLITTEGFRDILHIARHKRPQTFSLQLDLPWQTHQLVRRRHRFAVAERIVPPGTVAVPLDENAVRGAVEKMLADGIEAIAICFLHAYLNPVHEARALAIVREMAPDVYVCASHQVIPQYREYERFSTTALNAYVGPKSATYLQRLAGDIETLGVGGGLHLMQSSGGATTLAAAVARPVNLLMSGPAGGLIGGIWVGRSAGYADVITLDVGGTSADIGLAPSGQIQFKHILDTRIGDYHAMVPMAQLDAIGAGGGSIAYIDAGGQFQVGPRSAGSEPGPACYARGGTEPTATDCMVALGRIDPAAFLGGRLPLDAALARQAIESKLAARLGGTVEEAALGAVKILTHSMIQAIEVNSVRSGHDPRDFALVAFGGAGPLFACDIARELSIPRVIVPTTPGLTSALGLLASDVTYEQSRTVMQNERTADSDLIAKVFADLEADLLVQLRADGFDETSITLLRFADCRYAGQGYELRTPAPAGAIDDAFMQRLHAAFDAEHVKAYGKSFPEKSIQIVNLRAVGVGAIPTLEPAALEEGGADVDPKAIRTRQATVFEVDGDAVAIDTPRYERALLKAGNVIAGPAVIDQMDTTTVLPPGTLARVDKFGSLIVEVGA
ncbi:MAG: hydantoinase/oxoprolinase family protein [Rhizobiaceae bacterium]|nr:hydantoinase/oxoprolinase family protein [Rhizobiaceae bacterium]